MKKFTTQSITLAATLICGFALTACEAPKGVSDYQVTHKIETYQKNLSISFADKDLTQALSGNEHADFERFMSTYHLSGQGPVIIQASDNGNAALRAERVQAMRDLLRSAGVSNSMITDLPFDTERNAAITLSYVANMVKVPDCNNWNSSSSYNWSNRRHDNFGCATQRNLGLTIANPGDLKRTSPMSPSDGTKAATVIDTYRAVPSAAGTVTSAAETK